ncbi:glycosyltransferase family 87 protein [Tardiphaga sp.]|jgi:arabinofuranan 3-O-arabinosyltransferase|uniref:glycosyltransferase family 87 protein n=1 Tax=Tardiphaga sp. TaxID=1926292 RepID=UPI0037DA6C5F
MTPLHLTPSDRGPIPPALVMVCAILAILQIAFFPLYYGHGWIVEGNGLGVPTDFINVWSAGRLVLDGHPASAYDWDIQKQVQIGVLGQTYPGNFAWHYPPPFLFVASLLAKLPYAVAFAGWACISVVPYLVAMRTIVGRPFGMLLALAFPVVFTNVLVGQNGFLTASLIGGMLVLLPTRPILAGICLGLLSYKPQYGVLFPLVLIAAAQWRAFASAAVTTILLAVASWLAFGTESWLAFFKWMPMFSQAFLVEGRAPFGKMQSIFALVRYFEGGETLAWTLQWILVAAVAVSLVWLWRSRTRYEWKAAGLAIGALLATPYLFLYDVMVLAIAVGFLIRVGVSEGFLGHELPALGLAAVMLVSYQFIGPVPTGFGAAVLVAALIGIRIRESWPARSVAATQPGASAVVHATNSLV